MAIKDKKYLDDIEEYLKTLLADKNIIAILLYGSLSKGLAKPYPESDIDLLIIARDLLKGLIDRRFRALELKKRPMAIEDIWLTPSEFTEAIQGGWGLILDAVTDGVFIYDPDNLLEDARRLIDKKYKRMGKIWSLTGKQNKRCLRNSTKSPRI